MSAFQCSNRHLSELAALLVECGQADHATWEAEQELGRDRKIHPTEIRQLAARKMGLRLYRMNAASVAERYREARAPDAGFVYDRKADKRIGDGRERRAVPDAVQAIKAAHCFAYQASEAREWSGSPLAAQVDRLVLALTHHLPGYDGAEWGWP